MTADGPGREPPVAPPGHPWHWEPGDTQSEPSWGDVAAVVTDPRNPTSVAAHIAGLSTLGVGVWAAVVIGLPHAVAVPGLVAVAYWAGLVAGYRAATDVGRATEGSDA